MPTATGPPAAADRALTRVRVRRLLADAYRDGLRDAAATRSQRPERVADQILAEHALGEA